MTPRLVLAGVTATAASASSTALVATAVWLIVTAAGRPGIAALAGAIVAVRALAVSAGLLRYVERLTGHDAVLARLTERRAAVVAGLAGRSGLLARGRWVHRLVSDVDAEGDLVVRGALPAVAVGVTGLVAVALAASVAPASAAALAGGLTVIAALVPAAVRRAGTDARRSDPAREALSASALELARAGADLAVLGGLDRARAAAADLAGRIAHADRTAARAQAVLRAVGGLAVALAVTGAVAGAADLAPAWAAVLPVVASAVLAEAFVLLVAAPRLAAARAARGRLSRSFVPEPRSGDGPAPTGVLRNCRPVHERVAGRGRPGCPGQEPGNYRSGSERVPGAARPGPAAAEPDESRSDSERVSEDVRPGPLDRRARPPHLHLRDPALDLDLPPGARVLLTGASGSGKSTLLAQLWRVRVPRGTYTVDGVDAAAFGTEGLRNLVGGLWQDAHVPRSTLRDALRIARPDAPDQHLREALATVGLAPDVLQDGLDGVLAENAENLSGGQRRRVLVARTLLADHPVMLFDEPVEGLSPPDANRLLSVLFALEPASRTVLVVSHHVPDRLPPGVVHRSL